VDERPHLLNHREAFGELPVREEMKAVTKFKSDNGRLFDTEEEARKSDALFAAQNEVSKLLLQAVDRSCDFSNGGGFIQHSKQDIDAFTAGIRNLIVMEFGDKGETLRAFDVQPNGFVGRYLDDSGSNTYRLWCRLRNIDSELREWGQGYYALNPTQGTQKPWPYLESRGMKYYD
jgi:hypothetical protein